MPTDHEQTQGESRFGRWYGSSSYDWFMLGFIAGGIWVGMVVWLVSH